MAGIGFSLEIKGLENLTKKLKSETIKKPLAEGIKKITLFLDKEIKMATPVDTGRLRSSIISKVTPEFGTVGTNIKYATFVEYGTKRMEARHVTPGSSIRIFGLGMFGYGMKRLQEKLGEFLKDIGNAIEVRWG